MIEARISVGERLWKTPMILGQFLENMGDNIYGGIWDPSQPKENLWLGGIRKDVLELAKSVKPQIIRFPGGCAADYYHWQYGIGPRERRPVKPNYYWRWSGGKIGKPETYQFGTDEFLEFCKAVGAEPMITVNAGTGTPQEAAEWVEYCNGDSSTKYGRLRAKYGHRRPWMVKYWCVGNEQWGPWEKDSGSPEYYAKKFLKFAKAMRSVDPDIKLVACGLNVEWGERVWPQLLPTMLMRPIFNPLKPFFNPLNWRNWNERLLKLAGHEIDILSFHDYFPDTMRLWRWRPKPTPENYYWIVSGNIKTEKMLREMRRKLRVTVCLDEWNVRYDLPSHHRCNYTLAEGLYAACMLNSLLRIEGLFCANYAQFVNALGMIVTHEKGAYLAPPGQVFRLYALTLGEFVYEVQVDSPSMYSKVGKVTFSLVDASATGNHTISLHVVNRALEEARIRLDEKAKEVLTVTGPEPFAFNTPEEPERVTISKRRANGKEVILPPHSASSIVLQT